MNVGELKNDFPSIEVAVKTYQYHTCMNTIKKKTEKDPSPDEEKKCREDYEDFSKLHIKLTDFVTSQFSRYEAGKSLTEQEQFPSVWHWYTTLHEFADKFTGFKRYEKHLCTPEHCVKKFMYPILVENGTKEELAEKYKNAVYFREDIGIFLKRYDYELSETDVYSLSLEEPGDEHKVFIYKDPESNFQAVQFDTNWVEATVSSTNNAVTSLNTTEVDFLRSRIIDNGNKIYISQWEAGALGIPFGVGESFVLEKEVNTKVLVTYGSALAAHNMTKEGCVFCNNRRNFATPFMPANSNGSIQSGWGSKMSPMACYKAAQDMRDNAFWRALSHLTILVIVWRGFLSTYTEDADVKTSARMTLWFFFLFWSISILIQVNESWKCTYVNDLFGANTACAAIILVFGFFGLIYEFGDFGFMWRRSSNNKISNEAPVKGKVTGTLGTIDAKAFYHPLPIA